MLTLAKESGIAVPPKLADRPGMVSAKSPRGGMALLTPRFGTSSFQDCERGHFCCCKPPILGPRSPRERRHLLPRPWAYPTCQKREDAAFVLPSPAQKTSESNGKSLSFFTITTFPAFFF